MQTKEIRLLRIQHLAHDDELIYPNGITICQNGGFFNELTHYHMHVVPRYKNQSFYSGEDVCIELI